VVVRAKVARQVVWLGNWPWPLRYGDDSAQPGEYSDRNLNWINFRVKPRDLGQRLAQKLAIDLELDPSEGYEIGDISKDR
jgi:hypothetical protein